MIVLEIGGVDVTNRIKAGSLQKEDQLNQKTDTLKFTIEAHAGDPFTIDINEEVTLEVDSVLQFGGTILKYNETTEGEKIIRYDIECEDYSREADRLLIQEQFENESVNDIIDFLVTEYAPGFTTTNVNCTIVITTITFDRIPLSQALEKLSKLTNFSYYFDYEKDIHFFAKNEETASFNLTDTSNNYLSDSLFISRDLSQLRNQVYVRGGEIRGELRTELFAGDGEKKTFALGNKFAEKPTVKVNTVTKTVGIDFLDQEADFDCFWNFQQKYVRFKDTTIPPTGGGGPGDNNIEVTGIPLFTLVMRVTDDASIATHGVWEFSAEDKTIKSREEAKTFGIAQLELYANSVVEGSFKTYTPGLRSGQLITVNSTWRSINESFLIQKVSFRMINPDNYLFTVQLATLRTLGMIDFLIGLLMSGKANAGDGITEVLEKVIFESETVTLEESVVTSLVHNPQNEVVTMGESVTDVIDAGTRFVAGPFIPSGTDRVFILNGSRLG